MALEVIGIETFPVKSVGGEKHQSIEVTPHGLAGDRTMVLVEPNDDANEAKLISRKGGKNLVLAAAFAAVDEGELVVCHPDMGDGDLRREIRTGSIDSLPFKMHGEWITGGVVQDPELSDFFSTLLGKDVQLVGVPDQYARLVDPSYLQTGHTTNWADSYPVTVHTLASELAVREMGNPQTSNNQVRSNIIVGGVDTPFTEFRWRSFQIGAAVFGKTKASTRCAMVDQFSNPEEPDVIEQQDQVTRVALRKLGLYGQNKIGGNVRPIFAQNAVVIEPGTISVGDPVTILGMGTPNIIRTSEDG